MELRDFRDAEQQLVKMLPELASGARRGIRPDETLRGYSGDSYKGSSLTNSTWRFIYELRSWLAGTERTTHIEPKFRLFPWAKNPNR
jgi:hypothetical protein